MVPNHFPPFFSKREHDYACKKFTNNNLFCSTSIVSVSYFKELMSLDTLCFGSELSIQLTCILSNCRTCFIFHKVSIFLLQLIYLHVIVVYTSNIWLNMNFQKFFGLVNYHSVLMLVVSWGYFVNHAN